MIIKTEIVEKIRTRLNSLVPSGPNSLRGFIPGSGDAARALEIAVREAFAGIVESMALSDGEEEIVQFYENKNVDGQAEATASISMLLKIIRTRHARRVVFKSPGRTLHEAFHSHLNKLGESKYGTGCWAELSPERVQAWEAAAVELANQVVLNKVQLRPTVSARAHTALRFI